MWLRVARALAHEVFMPWYIYRKETHCEILLDPKLPPTFYPLGKKPQLLAHRPLMVTTECI
jgi:hypothetical protein